MKLNPEQQIAVTYGGGPLLVLAGAGSGKTRVLTCRIAHLLMNQGVGPDDILAVTFTNKAAGEMKVRVEELTGMSANSMWISTFHSFCLRILRRYADRLGYRSGFVVFDESDQLSLIKGCLKELNVNENAVSPPVAVNKISRAKDDYITSDRFAGDAQDFWERRFAGVYSLYQAELLKQNAMDFGDLLVNVTRLFETHPDILKYFQHQFKYILVDEYQDTNHVQYRLVKTLAEVHQNLFVVGDEDQSIYRWRGADIRNILEFKKDFPDAEVVKLEQNYRSTPTILNAANSVVRNNKGRLGKHLWSNLPDQDKVKVVQKTTDLEEAKYVAREVESLGNKGFRYNDMAIFYRTNAQSRLFEEYFRKSGIPYIIYGGIRFYERMEIKDILAYLKYILDKHNDTALLRIINAPPRGIGKTTVEKIRACAREKGCCFADAVFELIKTGSLSSRSTGSLKSFMDMIDDIRTKLSELTLSEITKLLIEASGYLSSSKLSRSFDMEDRVENVHEFVRATGEFEGQAEETLPQFLDQVALVSGVDNMDNQRGVVPLMTLHLSKGLEFKVVFMVGMEEGLFPHSNSLDTKEELEEERRICYVGMTRAREKLYMIYCSRRRLYGREQYNLPSRFIDEIDAEFIERERSVEPYGAFIYGSRKEKERNFEPSRVYDSCDHFDQRPEDERNSGFKVGIKVRHPVFGEGIVRRVEGSDENQKIVVQFNTGQIKTLIVKYAQLEVLN